MTSARSRDPRGVGWLLESWARRTPTRPFLRWAPYDDAPATWTRAELAADVDRLARGLHARGVRPGDRFALVLPNRPALLLAWCALTSMGAVAVCLDPRLAPDELAYALGHSRAVGALTTPERADDVAVAAGPGAVVLTDAPAGGDSLAALRDGDHPAYPRGAGGPAPASVQYTSGTTARPKGVVWTHASCLWAGRVGALHQGLGPADVNLLHLPLFHTNALSYSFLSSLHSGGELVLVPRFSASRFWETAVEHGATWSSVVSFCLRALEGRDVPERHAFRGWASSAVVAPGEATGGVGAIGWFGMTETVSHPVVSDLHHPGPAGSMGRPSPAYDVRVAPDPEADPPDGGDVVGTLEVRGERGVSLFAGYLGDEAATAAAFTDDGWFRTGDRVRLDAEGYLWFVERDGDVLKVGGENIGAPEVERVLRDVPGVREVAVVGRPDRMLGEVPVAFLTARDGERVDVDAAHARCARLLTGFKRPREIRVVDELPRSTLDKVAKSALRAQLAREVEHA